MHGAFHDIVARRSFTDCDGYVRGLHDLAIGELDFFQTEIVAEQCVRTDRDNVCELTNDGNRIAGRIDREDQVRSDAFDRNF